MVMKAVSSSFCYNATSNMAVISKYLFITNHLAILSFVSEMTSNMVTTEMHIVCLSAEYDESNPVMGLFMVFNATFNNISVILWWLVKGFPTSYT